MADLLQLMNLVMHTEIGNEADRENIIKALMENCIQRKQIPIIIQNSKNDETAKKLMDLANKSISFASLEQSVEKYNIICAFASPDSELLARAYANRSAVLTNGALYEDSLKDIERALDIGYPDNLKAKLYARKAKNLLALNNKICPEVEKAVAQANLWIEKMDESNKKKVLSALNQLKVDKSIKKPVENWKSSTFLPETPNGNPKILRASKSIDIKWSQEFGRHVVATKNINAGETITVNRFYAFILDPEYMYRNCSQCGKHVYSSVPCNQCANVIYCDKNCRDIAWKEYHDVECAIMTTVLRTFANAYQIQRSLRLLVKALKEYGTIDVLHEKIQEINSIDDPILKCFTGNVFDDTKYESVYSLFRLNTRTSFTHVIALSIVEMLFVLSATTEIFGKKYDDPTELVSNKLSFFAGNLLFKHMEIMDKNAIGLPVFIRGELVAQSGSFVAPLMDIFNHSCDPNAFPFMVGDKSAIFAVQPIKKGQQISVTYGPYYFDFPAYERRLLIQNRFKFFCKCIACTKGWGPATRHSSCQEKLSDETKNEMMENVRKFNNGIPKMIPPVKQRMKNISCNDITNLKAEISALLNILGADNYPCQEMIEVKHALLEVFRYIMVYDSII